MKTFVSFVQSFNFKSVMLIYIDEVQLGKRSFFVLEKGTIVLRIDGVDRVAI